MSLMAVRRRTGASNDEKENTSRPDITAATAMTAEAREAEARRRNSGGARDLCIAVAGFLVMVSAMLGYLVHRLGFAFLIPSSFKRLSLTPAEAEQEVAGHTFLFVGGPHRGGTTILWKCLREHPSISGFPDWVGTDYSEGMFLQSVYPTFGIGRENIAQGGWPGGRRRSALDGGASSAQGLGAYGFNPAHHLTEAYATVESRTMLMNEWGYLWNMTRPVLLEKSPPNMIISRFLQDVFSSSSSGNAGENTSVGSGHDARENARSGSEDGYTHPASVENKRGGGGGGGLDDVDSGIGVGVHTSANFVFISRHPIANALALGKYVAGGVGKEGLPDMFEQVLHWVVSHEIMMADMERLRHARLIRFEDFVMDPQRHLDDILEWIGLSPKVAEAGSMDENHGDRSDLNYTPPFRFETRVSRDTNRKYEAQYCEALRQFPHLVAGHRRLSAKLGSRVRALGYDLDLFPCVQIILRRHDEESFSATQ